MPVLKDAWFKRVKPIALCCIAGTIFIALAFQLANALKRANTAEQLVQQAEKVKLYPSPTAQSTNSITPELTTKTEPSPRQAVPSLRLAQPNLKPLKPGLTETLTPESNDDLGLITGIIIDQRSQDPLGKVHVTVADRSKPNQLPLEEDTNQYGQFWHRVQRGVYLVTFERAGYLKVVRECHVQRQGGCSYENMELQKITDKE